MKRKKIELRERRRRRVRAVVKGTAARPRMSLFRSNRHIWVQLIDDAAARTLAASSDLKIRKKKQRPSEAAARVGEEIARTAQERGIRAAVFDRGPYRYHGIARAVCEAARKSGLMI